MKNTVEEWFEVCLLSSKNRSNANAARVENFTLSVAGSLYKCFAQRQIVFWRKADLLAFISTISSEKERQFRTTRPWQFHLFTMVNLKLIKRQRENGTRRAQIPRKPLIFPSPNKQTNRQTKNFVHTEVRTVDPRVYSTMLLPTEL